jgi:transmembrane sensor
MAPMSDARDERRDEQAFAWLARLRGGDADARDRAAFQVWLSEDPANGPAFRRAESLWDEVGQLPDPRWRLAPEAGRRPGRRPGWRPGRRPGRRRLAGALAVAASVALLGVASLLTGFGPAAMTADAWTRIGEVERIALPDGSTAILNTDSAIALAFDEAARRVRLLEGEAFFEVRPDPARPFSVSGGGGRVTAVGTAFAVRLHGPGAMTAVEEGRIRIDTPEGALSLSAGEAAGFSAAAVPERAGVQEVAGWRHGRLVFRDRSLAEVVAELDRYRPGLVVLLDERLAAQRFSGALSVDDTDAALAAIEAALPIQVVRAPFVTLLTAAD